MMNELDPVEYLQMIKKEQSELLFSLYENHTIGEYILNLNYEMLQKYPDMVIEVIPEDREERN